MPAFVGSGYWLSKLIAFGSSLVGSVITFRPGQLASVNEGPPVQVENPNGTREEPEPVVVAGSKIVPFGKMPTEVCSQPGLVAVGHEVACSRSRKSVYPLFRSAAVGTEPICACPWRSRQNCASPKKKTLFLMTGPPNVPPN